MSPCQDPTRHPPNSSFVGNTKYTKRQETMYQARFVLNEEQALVISSTGLWVLQHCCIRKLDNVGSMVGYGRWGREEWGKVAEVPQSEEQKKNMKGKLNLSVG